MDACEKCGIASIAGFGYNGMQELVGCVRLGVIPTPKSSSAGFFYF